MNTNYPEPGDCNEEWSVKFTNFQRAESHPFFDLDGKVIVGSLYTVDFDCPGCGHEHKTISFIGWPALSCQGCGATLNREEPAYSSWSFQMLRDMNTFWSLCLSWLAVNRPTLRISGRTAAKNYCHKFDATIEEFVVLHELKESDVARYLNSKLP